MLDNKTLFEKLFFAKTEDEVDKVIFESTDVFAASNWYPIGNNESNFGIIENQQSSPIAALVEKVTNSIDALLMKRCYELSIDPKSIDAPKSMDEAIAKFYPDFRQWDLRSFRRKQSEEIQILADGPPRNTSVIIYDNGEGQHPYDFESTFLSLVRGNKNDIMFVQGKYNMGGSGAIVFCGKKGYQLIGSRKFDGSGDFGFTLIREHPFPKSEQESRKNTWYEFLKIDGVIPNFAINELDIGLHDRKFITGTIIKLYSYQFPSGYSGFAQDLNQSLNEFLFEPVLPILTVDKKERYPNNKVLELDLFGLKRRLEDDKDYVETYFSEEYEDILFGQMKVTCYVFKAKLEGKSVKESKEDIQRRFFKNYMSTIFSINGQAHGHYTSEFITRNLKFNLLKDYLLVHVDCTKMNYDFRKELFMASRDRLKHGSEANQLRDYLGKKLRNSQLDEINHLRKSSIGLESEDTNDLIKSFAKNLPKDSELFKLLQNTLKLEEKTDKQERRTDKAPQKKEDKIPFMPKRFPSLFKLHNSANGETPIIAVPQIGEKVLKFDTDVEDHYFDRTDEAGELQVALMDVKYNNKNGEDKLGKGTEPGQLINIVKSSPKSGTIKIGVNPTKELNVGDQVQIKVSLTGPDLTREELVWLKIVEPEAPKEKANKEEQQNVENIGLPELVKVNESQWAGLEQNGISMTHETVLYPIGEGDKLEKIYVNLDSSVYLNYRKKLKSENQIITSQKRYLAAIYFHSLFLYMISKKKGFKISTVLADGNENERTTDEYIREVFDSYYSDFLLNFGMEQLMNALED